MNKHMKLVISIIILTVLNLIPLHSEKVAATTAQSPDVSIGENDSFYMLLKKDGTVWTWGKNNYGQLGDGTNTDRQKPVQVSGLTNIVSISTGNGIAFAVKEDGTVWVWGKNWSRLFGNSKLEQTSIPVQIENLQDVREVALGDSNVIALKKDGTVWSWGRTSATPAQIQELNNVSTIEANDKAFYAVKIDGTVWNWWVDLLKYRETREFSFTIPVQITGLSSVADLSATRHILALKKDGTVWSWGDNHYGQLGDGTKEERKTPVKVKGLENVSLISAGEYHSVAVKKDGTVWAWGNNGEGQLGVKRETVLIDPGDFRSGKEVKHYSEPVKVSITGVQAIDAGLSHTVALKQDGSEWIWGNEIGEITRVSSSQTFAIEPKYSYVKSFSEGLAFANGQFIDKTGTTVLELPYSRYVFDSDAYVFKNGLAMIVQQKDSSSAFQTKLYGLIDKTGKEIVKPMYESPLEFNNGLANIYQNGKNGFINTSGKVVIKPQYDPFGLKYEFSEGLTLVHQKGKYGFINTNGKFAIPLKYSNARNFSNGLALIAVGDKYGYIDKTGKVVIKPQYVEGTSFNEGLAAVWLNGKMYIIDKSGKKTAVPKSYFVREQDVFKNGLLKVYDNNGYAFINKNGKRVSKYYRTVLDIHDGLAIVITKAGKFGFVNTTGKEVIAPKYAEASNFNEGLALVKSLGKYGFIDKTGKEVIKPQFEDAMSFSEGLAAVKVNGSWGYIANPLKN